MGDPLAFNISYSIISLLWRRHVALLSKKLSILSVNGNTIVVTYGYILVKDVKPHDQPGEGDHQQAEEGHRAKDGGHPQVVRHLKHVKKNRKF